MRAPLFLLLLALAAPAAAAPPACWPAQVGGCGNAAIVRTNSAGMVVAWAIPADRTIAIFGGTWSNFQPNWQQLGAEIVAGGPAAMAASWQQLVTPWPKDAAGVIQPPAEIAPIAVEAFNAAKASLPPPSQWKVAPYSTLADRPAYPWLNGARGKLSNGRAAVGLPCDPAVGSVEFAGAFYGVNGRTDQVSLCVRQ